jgi:hypothetical protein
VPAAIVPTPAAGFATLRGRRVIIGVPGLGFRGDLRADDPVVRGGRTYVPVLTEQDYYRAETEQVEVFAPLVPVDRVWVEQVDDLAWAAGLADAAFGDRADYGPASLAGIARAGAAIDAAARAPLDAPSRTEPVAVSAASTVLGRRVVQAVPDGFVRDLRAVTRPYPGGRGDPGGHGDDVVRVCAEPDWYRWALAGTAPATVEVRARDLWVE